MDGTCMSMEFDGYEQNWRLDAVAILFEELDEDGSGNSSRNPAIHIQIYTI